MRKIFTIIILFLYSHAYCQKVFERGTLIFGVICSDGILLAGDSRTMLTTYDKYGKKMIIAGYVDSFQKVFKIANFYIGFSGNATFQNTPISQIVKSFNSNSKSFTSIKETLDSFINYACKIVSITEREFLKNNGLLIVGYEGRNPIMIAKDKDVEKKYTNVTDMAQSLRLSKRYTRKDIYPFECKNVLPMIDSLFISAANETKEVGFPIAILKIQNKHRYKYIKKFKFRDYKYQTQFFEDILSQKLQVSYLNEEYKELLLKTIGMLLNRGN